MSLDRTSDFMCTLSARYLYCKIPKYSRVMSVRFLLAKPQFASVLSARYLYCKIPKRLRVMSVRFLLAKPQIASVLSARYLYCKIPKRLRVMSPISLGKTPDCTCTVYTMSLRQNLQTFTCNVSDFSWPNTRLQVYCLRDILTAKSPNLYV